MLWVGGGDLCFQNYNNFSLQPSFCYAFDQIPPRRQLCHVTPDRWWRQAAEPLSHSGTTNGPGHYIKSTRNKSLELRSTKWIRRDLL